MKINFKRYFTCLFLAFPLLLTTCQKSPTGPPGIRDLFPLAVGNYWLYEGRFYPLGPIPSEIREEIIGKDHLSDGSSVFVKTKISTDQNAGISDTLISYLKFEGDELREYSSKDYICQFKILLKAPLYIGAEWSTDNCFCPACPLVVAFEDSVEATENVSVPAGEFFNCYRIVTCNCAASVVTDVRWLEPNLGITKFMVEAIWGTETYELKEYRVR